MESKARDETKARRDELAAALAGTLATRGHDGLELEFRLGRVLGGAFVAGVPRCTYDALLAKLCAPAHEIDTVEYLVDRHKYVITTRFTGGPCPPPRWTTKDRVAVVDLGDLDVPGGGTCRVRGSLAMETWAPGTTTGPPDTKYARVKHRKQFRYGIWTIDATEVRSNLPEHADEPDSVYELEIELADPGVFFERPIDWVLEYAKGFLDTLVK